MTSDKVSFRGMEVAVGTTITVPTKVYDASEPQQRQVELSAEGIESLKKNDKFLFHSVPSVRDALMHCHGFVPPTPASTQTVVRRTRLSTEAHPSVLFEDLLDLLHADDEDDDDDLMFEDLLEEMLRVDYEVDDNLMNQ